MNFGLEDFAGGEATFLCAGGERVFESAGDGGAWAAEVLFSVFWTFLGGSSSAEEPEDSSELQVSIIKNNTTPWGWVRSRRLRWIGIVTWGRGFWRWRWRGPFSFQIASHSMRLDVVYWTFGVTRLQVRL